MQVNDEEIELMAGWIGCSTDLKEAAAAFAKKFNIQIVCITRGGDGAALWLAESGTWLEHPGWVL